MKREDLRTIASTVFQTVLWCLVLGVLVEDVVLLRQNRRLRMAQEAGPQMHVGQQLRNLGGVTLSGEFKHIVLPDSPSQHLVVFTFSPGCPACQASQTQWALLAQQLERRTGWRVLWVSRDPISLTSSYCAQHEIPSAEVLAEPTYATHLQLALGFVPNTVAVGPGGVIEKVWTGKMNAEQWQQVFSYFGAEAPHL